jgi:hypothetical protein
MQAEALTIGFNGEDHTDSVTEDLILTDTGKWNTSVSWQSNKDACIYDSDYTTPGHVVRPTYSEGDHAVILTAAIDCPGAGYTQEKTFTVTVQAEG